MSRAQKAKDLFMEGYACSHAVALAFLDLTDIDEAPIVHQNRFFLVQRL